MTLKQTISLYIVASLSVFGLHAASEIHQSIDSFMPMVEIPAGSFYMGGDGGWSTIDETPIHTVEITTPFRMGVTPVTNAQFEAFCPEHRALRGVYGLSTADDDAVVNVTYQQALDFCRWLGETYGGDYRLPTEAEWEYACRAGTYSGYNTGGGLPKEFWRNQQNTRDYPASISLRVGQTTPNAFGLTDMHGLVEEWCMDWYGPYLADDQVNPIGPESGEFRVTRGGSHSTPPEYLRSGNRMAMLPADCHVMTGFRVVRNSAPQRHYGIAQPVSDAYSFTPKQWVPVADDEVIFSEPTSYQVRPSNPDLPFYQHNHQPTITWAPNGDMIVAWFSTSSEDGREMSVLSSRLPAGSTRWEPASLFFHIPDRNLTGSSLFTLPDGSIMHLNGMGTAGDWQNLAMVQRISRDCGHTWTPTRIVAPDHAKRHQIIHGAIMTNDGRIIQLCDAGPGGDDGTACHVSHDGGMTWTDQWDGSPVSFAPDSTGTTIAGIHAGIVELSDGRLMCLGRGNPLPGENGEPRMPMSISSDGGKTWHYSASEFPPLHGGQRLQLLRLHNGALLLVSFTDHPHRTPQSGYERGMDFVDADGNTFRGYGMYAALSFDDGKTWPVRKLITDGKKRLLNGGGWTGRFGMDATHAEPLGYLAMVQTPDHMIHLVSSHNYYTFSPAWLLQP